MTMNLDDGFASAIGHTPLIRLRRFPRRPDLQVYAKLEYMNPNGSAKDRPALQMVRAAIHDGRLQSDSVIVESSSGNMAISLAALCRYLGIRFICVLDMKTSVHNVRILRALGAELEWVEQPDAESGEFLPARLQRVRQLLAREPKAVWLNQYENGHNVTAHRESTMNELYASLAMIDYVFIGMSTCGTIRGCAEKVQEERASTKCIGVDVFGSKIVRDTNGPRLFPGLGAGIVPPFYRSDLIDEVVHVSDEQCVQACRDLASMEGILVGASSGGVCAAYKKMESKLSSGAVVVLIFHDRGERYLETVFGDG